MLRGSLIASHAPDCWYRARGMRSRATWVCPEHSSATPIGHKTRKSMWVFRCNCSHCPAKLGVRTEEMYRLWKREMGHLQNKGFGNLAVRRDTKEQA